MVHSMNAHIGWNGKIRVKFEGKTEEINKFMFKFINEYFYVKKESSTD